ncbi:MAG: hypothetical protein AAGF12_29255 [Myxococcota bacterium]
MTAGAGPSTAAYLRRVTATWDLAWRRSESFTGLAVEGVAEGHIDRMVNAVAARATFTRNVSREGCGLGSL